MSSTAFATRSLTGRFYHPELDSLRFFAFFLAFLHHSLPHYAGFYTAMGASPGVATALAAIGNTGAFGVNLFFLLSAYLITELLIRERVRFGQIDLRAFYVRRILRIWPLYFAFLAFAWALQWYVPTQHIGWRAELAFVFLGGNWWVVFVGFPSSVIFPLWSLSVEEQFYIVWPALMRRLTQRGMLCASAVMLAMANLTRWYLSARHTWESKLWTNSFVQLDAIALGIVLAVLLAGRAPRIAAFHRFALFAGGLACFAVAANYFEIKGDPVTMPRVLLGYPTAILGTVAIFLATLRPVEGPQVPPAGNGESSKSLPAPLRWGLPWERGSVLVYLGRISYGLYVFHVLGLMITDYTIQHHDSSLGRYLFRDAVGFGLALIFASLSYHWFEMPFLKLKQRFTHVVSRPGG